MIGWRLYAKHYTVIILLSCFFSLLIDVETPFFVIDYIFKVFLGLLLFTTQYWLNFLGKVLEWSNKLDLGSNAVS